MAAFATLVARTGLVEEFKKEVESNIQFLLVADDEADALAVALERFEDDALWIDWNVNSDDVDAYEKTNDEGEIIGWAIYAGGHENFGLEDED